MGKLNIAEENQVLVCSCLTKKGYVSIKDGTKSKQHHRHLSGGSPPGHTHWWWPSGDHVYWCVLRKGQFSYYKTKDEREAVDVLPRFDVLNYRVIQDSMIFNLYTKNKTLSFKVNNLALLQNWIEALDIFLSFKVEDETNKTIEGTVIKKSDSARAHKVESDMSSEDEAVFFDTEFGLHVMDVGNDLFEKNKVMSFNSELCNCTAEDSGSTYKNDLEFYRLYDPRNAEQTVRCGVLYARVKTHFNRVRWKKFTATLTNRSFKLCSLKSDKLKKSIPLDKIIDCVEIEDTHLDTLFALVLTDERLKFCSMDDNQVVDWIIAFKCSMLVRRKLTRNLEDNLS
ncbi:related to protein OPY1 [Zygosaccharomyces bailii]|nr:related to protein OPY1 [Zygosaccharomyces bailii]